MCCLVPGTMIRKTMCLCFYISFGPLNNNLLRKYPVNYYLTSQNLQRNTHFSFSVARGSSAGAPVLWADFKVEAGMG